MKTIEVQIYSFDELSEKAKQKAINNYRDNNSEIAWAEENRQTLEKFAEIFPIKITNWSYGGRGEGVSFYFTLNDCIEEMTGQRLAKYIWNNYKRDLFKGKYYSLWSKKEKSYKYYKEGYPVLKTRYSKILLDNSCVLTGYCVDDDILQPVYDFLNKPIEGVSFRDLLENCFDSWITACNNGIEYQNSDEYIAEELINNEYEFTENGKLY